MCRPLLVWALVGKRLAVAAWSAGYRRTAVILFVGPDPFVLYALFAPSGQGLVRVFTHFATVRSAVWLAR